MVTHKAGNRFFCKVSWPLLLQCMVCVHSASWCLVVDTSGHCYYSAPCHAVATVITVHNVMHPALLVVDTSDHLYYSVQCNDILVAWWKQ